MHYQPKYLNYKPNIVKFCVYPETKVVNTCLRPRLSVLLSIKIKTFEKYNFQMLIKMKFDETEITHNVFFFKKTLFYSLLSYEADGAWSKQKINKLIKKWERLINIKCQRGKTTLKKYLVVRQKRKLIAVLKGVTISMSAKNPKQNKTKTFSHSLARGNIRKLVVVLFFFFLDNKTWFNLGSFNLDNNDI